MESGRDERSKMRVKGTMDVPVLRSSSLSARPNSPLSQQPPADKPMSPFGLQVHDIMIQGVFSVISSIERKVQSLRESPHLSIHRANRAEYVPYSQYSRRLRHP